MSIIQDVITWVSRRSKVRRRLKRQKKIVKQKNHINQSALRRHKRQYYQNLAIEQGYPTVRRTDAISNLICALFFYEKPISTGIRITVLVVHLLILSTTFIGIYGIYLTREALLQDREIADYQVAYSNNISTYTRVRTLNRLLEENSLSDVELTSVSNSSNSPIELWAGEGYVRLLDGWVAENSNIFFRSDHLALSNTVVHDSVVTLHVDAANLYGVVGKSHIILDDGKPPQTPPLIYKSIEKRPLFATDDKTFKKHFFNIIGYDSEISIFNSRLKLEINDFCNDYLELWEENSNYFRLMQLKRMSNSLEAKMVLDCEIKRDKLTDNQVYIKNSIVSLFLSSNSNLVTGKESHIYAEMMLGYDEGGRFDKDKQVIQYFDLTSSTFDSFNSTNNVVITMTDSSIYLTSVYSSVNEKGLRANSYLIIEGGNNHVSVTGSKHGDLHIELAEDSEFVFSAETSFAFPDPIRFKKVYVKNSIPNQCTELAKLEKLSSSVIFVGDSNPCNFGDLISTSMHKELSKYFFENRY